MANPLAAAITKEALLRNLSIAEKLGCLDPEGLSEMRRGRAPIVRRGPYKGDELSVDHIIPRSVVPELDNVIANLGQRQLALAQKLYEAGLLSKAGLKTVQNKPHQALQPASPVKHVAAMNIGPRRYASLIRLGHVTERGGLWQLPPASQMLCRG